MSISAARKSFSFVRASMSEMYNSHRHRRFPAKRDRFKYCLRALLFWLGVFSRRNCTFCSSFLQHWLITGKHLYQEVAWYFTTMECSFLFASARCPRDAHRCCVLIWLSRFDCHIVLLRTKMCSHGFALETDKASKASQQRRKILLFSIIDDNNILNFMTCYTKIYFYIFIISVKFVKYDQRESIKRCIDCHCVWRQARA